MESGGCGVTPDDAMSFATYRNKWWPGVDQGVMEDVATSIQYMTVALYQARLGQWPTLCVVGGTGKLAWSMAQLVGVVESTFPDLERKVAVQEAAVTGMPRSLPRPPGSGIRASRFVAIVCHCPGGSWPAPPGFLARPTMS